MQAYADNNQTGNNISYDIKGYSYKRYHSSLHWDLPLNARRHYPKEVLVWIWKIQLCDKCTSKTLVAETLGFYGKSNMFHPLVLHSAQRLNNYYLQIQGSFLQWLQKALNEDEIDSRYLEIAKTLPKCIQFFEASFPWQFFEIWNRTVWARGPIKWRIRRCGLWFYETDKIL